MKTYTEKLLDQLGDHEPMQVLQSTSSKLEHYLYFGRQEDLEKSYEPGKWNAAQIMAHLADMEMLYGVRFRHAVAEDEGELHGIKQDTWAKNYHRLEPSFAVEAFKALRAWNLSLVSTFDLQDWLRDVPLAKREDQDVELMFRLWAAHDLNHLAQLEAIFPPKEF